MRGKFYKALTAAENVCFVGDSITHGTKNGGVPWFEPLEHLIRGKIFNVSQGKHIPAAKFVWCAATGDTFINPNLYIKSILDLRPPKP